MNQPRLDNQENLNLIKNKLKNILDVAKNLSDIVAQIENNKQLLASIGIQKLHWLISFWAGPQVQLVASILPLISLYLSKEPKKELQKPSFVECTAIVIPLAFCKSAQEILGSDRFKKIFSNDKVMDRFLSKELLLVKDDKEAQGILDDFPNSEFAKNFTELLKDEILKDCSGEDNNQIRLDVERIKYGTPQYIFEVLEQSKDVDILKNWFDESRQANYKKYKKIDDHIKQVQGFPKETVFGKTEICIESLYIPLKAKNKTKNKIISNLEQTVIDSVINSIDNKKSQDIILIEAGPGRGKTFFCKMFANRIANEIYPIFIPILIKLRNINLQQGFIGTLQHYFTETYIQQIDITFLNDFKFIFILDGFDEMQIQQNPEAVKKLFDQLQYFQENQKRHRIILTGRPFVLPRDLPDNLQEFEIQTMDDELREKWLDKWHAIYPGPPKPLREFLEAQNLPDQIKNDLAREPLLLYLLDDKLREKWLDKWHAIYPGPPKPLREFLEAQNLPDQIKNDLAREPLLLYLLADMLCDGEFQDSDLKKIETKQTKTIEKTIFYNQFFDWVIRKQRENLQERITGLEPKDLKTIITEAALCVVQGGTESSKIEILKKRLEKLNIVSKFNEILKDEKLNNALAAFYLENPSNVEKGGFEFYHKSFSEFLFAKRIYDSLPKCTDEKIYDLLGYGGLTLEIVEYLRGLWEQDKDFDSIKLFNDLENFYWKWYKGEFIDADYPTLPQNKMIELRKDQLPKIGQRQVDIYTGLNVMILLLELHRYARDQQDKPELEEKINFYLGKPPNDTSDLSLFLRRMSLHSIIGYCGCIGVIGFTTIVGPFLNKANLEGVYLNDAKLEDANLEGAKLEDAYLGGADLRGTNLGGADLRGTNLEGADLRNANLQIAGLIDAVLRGANLRNANLERSYLCSAKLEDANLRNANLECANLIRAKLNGANLTEAKLNGANLTEAKLRGANLTRAHLIRADLQGADLRNANLERSYLWNANLERSYLWNANLEGADLRGANLEGADLRGANLSGAILFDANLKGANLEFANLTRADLQGADLKGAKLQGANLQSIIWNERTIWPDKEEVRKAQNIPKELRKQLGL